MPPREKSRLERLKEALYGPNELRKIYSLPVPSMGDSATTGILDLPEAPYEDPNIPSEVNDRENIPQIRYEFTGRADDYIDNYALNAPRDWSMSIDGNVTSGNYSLPEVRDLGRDEYKSHMRNIFMPPPEFPNLSSLDNKRGHPYGLPRNTLGGYAMGWRGEYERMRANELNDYHRRRINSMVDVGIPPERYAGGIPKPLEQLDPSVIGLNRAKAGYYGRGNRPNPVDPLDRQLKQAQLGSTLAKTKQITNPTLGPEKELDLEEKKRLKKYNQLREMQYNILDALRDVEDKKFRKKLEAQLSEINDALDKEIRRLGLVGEVMDEEADEFGELYEGL